MSLDNFPWQLYLQAAQQKEQNRRQALQDAEGIGQNINQGVSTVLGGMKERQQKEQWSKTINTMMSDPNASQQIKQILPMLAQRPELAGQLLPGVMKPQRPTSPWVVVPGMLSKSGKPLQENKETGELRETSLDVIPTGRGNAGFGTGSITWESATPQDQDTAKALYEGRISPGDLGYRDRSIGVKLANEYAIKSKLPPYKAYAGRVAGDTAKAFATGKPGLNALALNTALGHVDSAYEAYEKVKNTDTAWLNQPLNALRKKTNDPNIVKLGLTLNALRGELATVFKGSSGTDQDAASWRDYLTENLTPEQINAAIPQVDELLRSRLSALNYQRSSGMTGRGETPLLSPHGADISKKFSGKNTQSNGGWSYVGPTQ